MLTSLSMRVATWNLERKKPTSLRGAEAIEHLRSLNAELVVVTEGRTSFTLPRTSSLWSGRPRGQRYAEDERKVILCSTAEMERIEFDSAIDPSRFVAARVDSSIGPIVVLAVCITWHMAEVVHHTGPKKKPWEEHLEYLACLRPIVRSLDEPFVVAGDFNQRYPRVKGGNRRAADELEATFNGIDIVTGGVLPGCNRPGIDHVGISSHLRATHVAGWPHDVNGNRLSDHDGALADVVLAN